MAAPQAVSEFDRWEALAVSRAEVGGEENASVLAAAAHGHELYLPSRKFPQCTAQAAIEGVALARTHLVRTLHVDDLVAARKLLGPEAGYEASAGACRRRWKGVASVEQKGNMLRRRLWKLGSICRKRLRNCKARGRARMWRLHGALNAVAQMQAARSARVVASFREMQEQARDIDRRRVQIAVRIAELQKVDGRSSGTSEDCACN
jgi:hypothetical protein